MNEFDYRLESESEHVTRANALHDRRLALEEGVVLPDFAVVFVMETVIALHDRVDRLRGWISEAQDIMERDNGNCEELFSEMAETHLRDGDLG